jgi:type VI secretion system secreted protein Hcp
VSPLTPASAAPATLSKPAEFIFVASSSSASPRLFLACARGTRINNVVLEVVRRGGEQPNYLRVSMQNVRVASYSEAPSASDGVPLDVVHLRCARITDSFAAQRRDGSLGPPVVTGFDFATNAVV